MGKKKKIMWKSEKKANKIKIEKKSRLIYISKKEKKNKNEINMLVKKKKRN